VADTILSFSQNLPTENEAWWRSDMGPTATCEFRYELLGPFACTLRFYPRVLVSCDDGGSILPGLICLWSTSDRILYRYGLTPFTNDITSSAHPWSSSLSLHCTVCFPGVRSGHRRLHTRYTLSVTLHYIHWPLSLYNIIFLLHKTFLA
jgi:hypothetical protein